MHAVSILEPGGPEVLTWSEVPDPKCGPGDVLIEVAASAVNRADLLQRQGHYPPPPGVPDWPGLECSGTVLEVGAHARSWRPGDLVCAVLAGGGYAERVAVPAGQVLPVPDGMDVVTAAALPEAVCTVWTNMVTTGQLSEGDVLLVHGGAGGIGTTAIQIGVALGATVAVTAGSAAKLARCADLGAAVLINYREDDFVTAVRDATGGRGADIVLDIIGAKYLTQNLDVLAPDGRLVVIGLQGGRRGEVDLMALTQKRSHLTGSTLRYRSVADKSRIVSAVRAGAWPLVAAGKVTPIIDRVLPMTSAGDAHRIVERSDHVGKIVLTTTNLHESEPNH